MNQDFENRLRELEFLSGCEESIEAFNEKYEELLNDVKAFQGPRYEKVLKLKGLQVKQGLYLCFLSEITRIEEGIEEDGNA
ncbi:MAG: hypothetical protein V1758_12880 [Pseudomonadota bacterium]